MLVPLPGADQEVDQPVHCLAVRSKAAVVLLKDHDTTAEAHELIEFRIFALRLPEAYDTEAREVGVQTRIFCPSPDVGERGVTR
jgi:hypothetical protein